MKARERKSGIDEDAFRRLRRPHPRGVYNDSNNVNANGAFSAPVGS